MATFFTPPTGIAPALIGYLNRATISIRCQIYELTSEPIATALAQAQLRGLDVQVIVDAGLRRQKNGHVQALASAGVVVWVDAAHKIMHDKVTIVDSQLVLTGSYNYSLAAETENAENLVVVSAPDDVVAYRGNWDYHRSHSTTW